MTAVELVASRSEPVENVSQRLLGVGVSKNDLLSLRYQLTCKIERRRCLALSTLPVSNCDAVWLLAPCGSKQVRDIAAPVVRYSLSPANRRDARPGKAAADSPDTESCDLGDLRRRKKTSSGWREW